MSKQDSQGIHTLDACRVANFPNPGIDSTVKDRKDHQWPLGELLQRYRLVRGMKQSHLAELIRVSQSTVSKWERGLMVPNEDQYFQIIELLGAKPTAVTDTWLARLIETSRDPIHAICDITHRLLVASPARYQEWRRDRGEMFRRPLLHDAPDDIVDAERRLGQRDHVSPFEEPVIIKTAGQAVGRYLVTPGFVLWERLQLTDGTWVRLVTSIEANRIPGRALTL